MSTEMLARGYPLGLRGGNMWEFDKGFNVGGHSCHQQGVRFACIEACLQIRGLQSESENKRSLSLKLGRNQ